MKLRKSASILLAGAMLTASASGFAFAEAEEAPMTIEIYDAAANFHGIQTGWFAKVVKDRFNIELNIIAPQVAGAAIYQTRAATGNLGDIVILDKGDFLDCLQNGLMKLAEGIFLNFGLKFPGLKIAAGKQADQISQPSALELVCKRYTQNIRIGSFVNRRCFACRPFDGIELRPCGKCCVVFLDILQILRRLQQMTKVVDGFPGDVSAERLV